jgi:hypothetical protein
MSDLRVYKLVVGDVVQVDGLAAVLVLQHHRQRRVAAQQQVHAQHEVLADVQFQPHLRRRLLRRRVPFEKEINVFKMNELADNFCYMWVNAL